MREILFRGFYPCKYGLHIAIVDGKQIKGTWSYGYPVKANTGEYVIMSMLLSPKHATAGDIIISETLGQFTGLLDKNGNKIFEGDIVKFYEVLGQQGIENPLIGTVVFKDGFFEISYNKTSTWYLSHAWKIEVIGNIHDNPELLGGAK